VGLLQKKLNLKMKQISIFFLILIALQLFQSCTNEDLSEQPLPTTAVEISTNSSFLTDKSIKDPAIFGLVKDITVTATQTATGYKATTLFTITNNTNDPSTYKLEKVLTGTNTFVAVTTSPITPKSPSYTSTPRNTTNSKVWATIDAQVAGKPYAIYSGSKGATLINLSPHTILNIPMSTTNGRFIAYFKHNSTSTQSTVIVTPYINEVAQASFTVTFANHFYWIWNDSNCIAGKNVRFSCVAKKNQSTKFTAQIPTVTIKSSTTSKYAYEFNYNTDSYRTLPRTP
jgi:hypothetical protein